MPITNRPDDLRERRLAAGLSQAKLAQHADCSASYVQMIERGLTPARGHVLPRLEAVLDELEQEHR